MGVAAAGLVLGCTTTATAQTIYTETAHKTSTDPTGGKPILATPGCQTVKKAGGVALGSACFKAYGDAWYVRDANADGADIEVHAIGNWGSPTTGFLCADKSGANGGWTTCNDWASLIQENHSIEWTVSAWKSGKQIAVSTGLLSSTS